MRDYHRRHDLAFEELEPPKDSAKSVLLRNSEVPSVNSFAKKTDV